MNINNIKVHEKPRSNIDARTRIQADATNICSKSYFSLAFPQGPGTSFV